MGGLFATAKGANNLAFDRIVGQDDIGGLNLGVRRQYYDGESGLRTNDPFTGRYLESGPIGLAGGLNSYAYVGGSPISHVDPSGLCADRPKEDCIQAALNSYSLESSFNSMLGFGAGTAIFGGAVQGLNKTATKPRGGIAGGGPSGQYTSYSRRYLGDTGRTIGRWGIGAVMKVGGILGAGVGAMTEHANAVQAYLDCESSQ